MQPNTSSNPAPEAQNQSLAVRKIELAAGLERVLIGGDLSELTPEDRLSYYRAVCDSLGLNPLTKPFEYIELNNKLVLYAKRDCTDQLRKQHGISVVIKSRELIDGVFIVTACASTPEGRADESVGAVPLIKERGEWKTSQNGKRYFQGNGEYEPLKPEDRANAMMKAETKSKRRVTLSICGLGMLDETEIESSKSIDTGGHPHGTQAAADAVAERKVAQARTSTPDEVPAELRKLVNDLPRAGGADKLFDHIRAAIEKVGDKGALRAHDARMEAWGAPFVAAGKVASLDQMQTQAIIEWNELTNLRQAKSAEHAAAEDSQFAVSK